MALAVGSSLGHYDVSALIGEGGMGQVYQATAPVWSRMAGNCFTRTRTSSYA